MRSGLIVLSIVVSVVSLSACGGPTCEKMGEAFASIDAASKQCSTYNASFKAQGDAMKAKCVSSTATCSGAQLNSVDAMLECTSTLSKCTGEYDISFQTAAAGCIAKADAVQSCLGQKE